MKQRIEQLKKELKYVLDENYTIINYLQDIWLDNKHCGIKQRHEAREMLKFLESEMNK